MSVDSHFKHYRSEPADQTILDHDHVWFEDHPDRFCRIRRALPNEFPGSELVAVMRAPGVGRVRSPAVAFLADDAHRLDDGAFPYPVLTPQLVKEESGNVEQALENIPERDIKGMFAAIGVPIDELEAAFKREREAKQHAKKKRVTP